MLGPDRWRDFFWVMRGSGRASRVLERASTITRPMGQRQSPDPLCRSAGRRAWACRRAPRPSSSGVDWRSLSGRRWTMIGRTLGHYRIESQIGAGGMGVVYLAHDERLHRDVTLKVLPAGTLADETARRRFRREAQALSKLNHPNIATVHDFDSQEGMDFLVMEHIPGMGLDERLAGGPLAEKEAVKLGVQLAHGLEAAHREGVMHRDLKPGNLRITPDGRLKILDFGLAKGLRQGEGTDLTSLTTVGEVVGTLAYMAPEQLRGERVDARTDLYAAGAGLYERATGRRAV